MIKNNYILDVGQSAAKRLTILNEAYGPYSRQFLKSLGLKPGMQVIDIGCGTGEMSLWFAKEVGPTGKVTGIDISEQQVKVAAERAKKAGLNNTEFLVKNIMDLNPIRDKFDLVYCRFVLGFLPQPLAGLKSMQHLVKTGGLLVAEEIECSTWSGFPSSYAYDYHIQLFMKLGASRGLDFKSTGPNLHGYFQQIGCEIASVSVSVPVFRSPEQKQHMVLVTKECAAGYIDAGLATQGELEILVSELQKLVADDKFLMLGAQVFQVAGRVK